MNVALVGGAPSSEGLAPFDDPEFEIWVHGNQMEAHANRRVTRIFEIHDDLSEHGPSYPEFLANKNIPMIVGPKFPLQGKHIKQFPVERANKLMGQHLTSTPAYMMALALLEGATDISIYGVDMSIDDHEYFLQRACMYAWIGYAKAKGVNIFIPKESGLFKDSHVEGNSGGKPYLSLGPFTSSEFSKVAQMHQGKVSQALEEIKYLEGKIHVHNGCIQSYERLAKVARAVEAGIEVKTLTEGVVLK